LGGDGDRGQLQEADWQQPTRASYEERRARGPGEDRLDEVKDRDAVADRAEDAVAIRGEDDVALPVDGADQV